MLSVLELRAWLHCRSETRYSEAAYLAEPRRKVLVLSVLELREWLRCCSERRSSEDAACLAKACREVRWGWACVVDCLSVGWLLPEPASPGFDCV